MAVIVGSFLYAQPSSAASLSSCAALNTQNEVYTLSADVSSPSTCFIIQANNITLDGQGHTMIYNGGYGISNNGGYDNITIKNLAIILGSSLVTNAHAIYANGMLNSIITNVSITTPGSNNFGIYISSSNSNTISGSTITTSGGNSPGIILSSSNSNSVSGNTISTSGNGAYGIDIYSSTLNTVSDNKISTISSDSYGIYVLSSNSNTISGSTITTSGGNGISIFVSSSNSNTISGSTITTSGGNGHGITVSSGNSNILSGNTLTTSGNAGYGIYILLSSTSSTISGNTVAVSGGNGIGIYLNLSSTSSTISGNTITLTGNNGYGIGISASSDSNTVSNNNVVVSGEDSRGIGIFSSNGNNIMGGSIISKVASDYYLIQAGATNNFTNMNFTESRKIAFVDTSSYFNYNNQDSGNLWLKTGVSVPTFLTRTISSWENTVVKWNDTSSTSGTAASYTLSGLLPSTVYNIYNTSRGIKSNTYTLITDAYGSLPAFTIALSDITEISVQNQLISSSLSYSDASASSTNSGESVTYSVHWTDESGLSGYIFSFDNCIGSFVNDSFAELSGTDAWSNVTKITSSTVGCTIKWKVYANDTSNNWAETTDYSYTTTGDTTPSDNTTPPTATNSITVTPEEPLTRISAYFKAPISNPSITAVGLSSVPVPEPSVPVYQYVEIIGLNFSDSDIDNATIEFKVSNVWIADNNVSSVYLARYDESWNKLRTDLVSSDADYNYYKSYTDGFSYFAVIGEKAGALPGNESGYDTEPPIYELRNLATTFGIVIALIAGLVVIAGIYELRKKGIIGTLKIWKGPSNGDEAKIQMKRLENLEKQFKGRELDEIRTYLDQGYVNLSKAKLDELEKMVKTYNKSKS